MIDPVTAVMAINRFGKYFLILVMVLNIVCVATAEDATDKLQTTLESTCNDARAMLAVGVMIMVILAAIVYAVGQVMGAETRARATVWATAMLTGAIIGALIYMFVPSIIGSITGGTYENDDPCTFGFNDTGGGGMKTFKGTLK